MQVQQHGDCFHVMYMRMAQVHACGHSNPAEG